MENIETPGLSQDYKNKLVLKKYQKMFSNTVMIIDEAHNIKENNSSKDLKVLPPIIKKSSSKFNKYETSFIDCYTYV